MHRGLESAGCEALRVVEGNRGPGDGIPEWGEGEGSPFRFLECECDHLTDFAAMVGWRCPVVD